MGHHICVGPMCDIVANRQKGTFTQKHWLHGHNVLEHTGYVHL